jgi:hypothetical protein
MANYGLQGILGNLPKASAAFVAGEQIPQQRLANEIGMRHGLLGLQGILEQRAMQQQQAQALQSIIPQLTDPAARMLAQVGDMRGAIGRQFPQQPNRGPVVVAPGSTLVDPSNPNKPLFQAPALPKENAESPLAKLSRERDSLPPGDPRRVHYDNAISKMTTHAPAARVNTTILPPQKTFENEDKLRADYTANPVVKSANEMQTAFGMIEAAYQRPSAANDLAMATKYMKILDPTSVVRESEFALAVNATGLLDKVQNYAAQITEGKKLNPNQRKDFYDSAKAINDAFQKQRAEVDRQYSEMTQGYGLNPQNVIPSLRRRASDKGGFKVLGVE